MILTCSLSGQWDFGLSKTGTGKIYPACSEIHQEIHFDYGYFEIYHSRFSREEALSTPAGAGECQGAGLPHEESRERGFSS